MKPRYLITTADERTWKFDRPVIFLGEWCCIYDRKHVWEKMDAIVAEPYGLGQPIKDRDHAEARALEERLIPILCDILNQFHAVQYSERCWRIILGHWLYRYINVIFNRVKTLEQCFKVYQISGTATYHNSDRYILAPQDSYSAVFAFNDEQWNNILIAHILYLLKLDDFSVDLVDDDEKEGFIFSELKNSHSLKRKAILWIAQKMTNLLSCLTRNSDAFIINSYLPKKEEIKLQLALKQFPKLWTCSKFNGSKQYDSVLRKTLTDQLVIKSESNFENICREMLFQLIPRCFLEDFSDLHRLVKQQKWPESPRFIFTSNNFDTDEVFKLYVADKIQKGCKYFVGQHGNYGVSRNHIDPSNEEITSDKFFTWGWTDGLSQHVPAFIFKTLGRKSISSNSPLGGLLLIELCLDHRMNTWDNVAEFSSYYKEQKRFVRALALISKHHLTVRLHSADRYTQWRSEQRWHEFDPSLKIDEGDSHIRDLISQSRLVVHSYDSTGILETLSQNIPTIAFWQNGFDHLRDSAKPYYQLLVEAGVVHLSPESAAQKINEVWNDIESWWSDKKTQNAREKFCQQYARLESKPIQKMKELLMDNMI